MAAEGKETAGTTNGAPRAGKVGPVVGSGRPTAQVRGVLAERVVISTTLDPWLPLRALVDYSGLGRRTLLGLMARESDPLPHYRLTDTGKIVVRRSEFDAWMEQYRHTRSRLDELIEQRRVMRAGRRELRCHA